MRYVLGLTAVVAVAVIIWLLFFRKPEQVPAPVNSVETEQYDPQSTTNLPPTLENRELSTDSTTSVDENSTATDVVKENTPTDLNPGTAGSLGTTFPSASDPLNTESAVSGQPGSEQVSPQNIDPATGLPVDMGNSPEMERMLAEKARKRQELEALRQQQETEKKKKKKKDNQPR